LFYVYGLKNIPPGVTIDTTTDSVFVFIQNVSVKKDTFLA
jgi:hypothetical protein